MKKKKKQSKKRNKKIRRTKNIKIGNRDIGYQKNKAINTKKFEEKSYIKIEGNDFDIPEIFMILFTGKVFTYFLNGYYFSKGEERLAYEDVFKYYEEHKKEFEEDKKNYLAALIIMYLLYFYDYKENVNFNKTAYAYRIYKKFEEKYLTEFVENYYKECMDIYLKNEEIDEINLCCVPFTRYSLRYINRILKKEGIKEINLKEEWKWQI